MPAPVWISITEIVLAPTIVDICNISTDIVINFRFDIKWHNDSKTQLATQFTTKLNCDKIMRLFILLGSIGVFLQQVSAQRSWLGGGYQGRYRRTNRDHPRRYHSDSSDEQDRSQSHRRRYQRHRYEDSYEGDQLRISSHELSRRVSKYERRKPDRRKYHHDGSDSSYKSYYPTQSPSYHHRNISEGSSHLLESTPEYTIETRGGDTIIEFARSGETQGSDFILNSPHVVWNANSATVRPTFMKHLALHSSWTRVMLM